MTTVIVMLDRAECLAPVPGTVPLGRGFTSLDSHGDFFFSILQMRKLRGIEKLSNVSSVSPQKWAGQGVNQVVLLRAWVLGHVQLLPLT